MDLSTTAEAGPSALFDTKVSDPQPTPPATRPAPRRRPWYKAGLHAVRRGHLYCGLFLLPWVMLYGVTAFLFNHPTAFSDQPGTVFGADLLAGTPMEQPPAPADLAAQVVAGLQARAKEGEKYTLLDPEQAKFTREFAFATAKGDGQEVNLLIDVRGSDGTVRARSTPAPKPEAPAAPFAIGGRPAGGGPGGGFGGGRGGGGPKGGERGPRGRGGEGSRGGEGGRGGDGLKLDAPLHERVRAAAAVVLEKTGFPAGDLTVTSVPDLSFLMDADGKPWRVTYNAQTGSVSGRATDEATASEGLSARRFLTSLHKLHGYPGEVNYRWVWSVVVDAMAFVMVFWGLSGILMWWQIKAARRLGAVVVVLSLVAAAWLGFGMHEMLAAAPAGR